MGKAYASPRSASPEKAAPVFSGVQADLFGGLAQPAVIGTPNAPALNIWAELLGAIAQALREARDRGLSRERIVDRMNRALPEEPRPLTKRQLDAWTANSKEDHRFPLEYLPAFCWAAGTDAPLRLLARVLGYELIDSREVAVRELGTTEIEIARLRRKSGALRRDLSG